jgi:hypothetical protein
LGNLANANFLSCGDLSKVSVIGEVRCDKCKETARRLTSKNFAKGLRECNILIEKNQASAIFGKIRKLSSYFRSTSELSKIFSKILALEGDVKAEVEKKEIPAAIEIVLDDQMEGLYQMGCFVQENHSNPSFKRFVSCLPGSPLNFFELHHSETGNVFAFVEYKPNSPFSEVLKKRLTLPMGRTDIISARKTGEFWKVLQETKCFFPEQISEINHQFL